ncbi:MAG: QWxxN domain, partial [Enterococcus sp.]
MPQKVKMTKKIRLPQANSREVIGKGNNKRNDKNKSGNDQAKLNYIANRMGQTLAPDGLLTLDGILFLSNIFYNARLVDPPVQQTVIKKNAPAFEANTRIDVRRDGNQTRIHSFVSTSTINRERIQSLNTPPTMPYQSTSIASPFISTSPFFANQTFPHQTSTSEAQDIDIAKRAHELSLSVHQSIHNIYQLLNCSTTRRTDQVNTYIIGGESVEQTSIQTICQEAVGQAERRNDQGMEQESELFSPTNTIMTDQGTYSFSAEEAAQKISKSFQATYKNKQNVPTDDPNVHNQVTETFWKGLTDLFYQFFFQHEQTAYTQEQKETSGSFMSNFVDWLQSTFSVNYGEQIPNHNQTAQYRKIPMTTHPTDHSLPSQASQKKSKKKMPDNNPQELASEMIPQSVGEAAPILSLKEERFLSSFWHLAADFYGRVDGYIQYFNFDIFPHLVAEARPIIPTDVEETEEILLGYEKLSASTVLKINRIMTEYLDRQPLTVSNKEPFPPFWSDQETFQLRHKIEVVNQEVKKYLCDQGVPCDGLSGVELLEAVENWVEKDGDETKKNRKIRLAQVIRKASGLQNRDLKYTKAAHILLQWKNNNIFKDYQFKELEQQPISEIPTTIEGNTVTNQNNETIQSTTPLPSVEINPQLQCSEFLSTETRLKLNHVLNLYINGSMFNKELQESIPKNLAPFWYDLELFEKRDQTDKVNNDVKALICKQGQKCRNKVMTGQSLFLEIRDWEKSKDAQTVRINRKNVARNILKSSGLFTRSLNAEGVELILFQWINNNIFKDYKFKDIRKTHAKTTEELNESQSSTPTPITSVTIALTTGEFSKGTQTKLDVTEMPIFTTRFDEALLKSYEILSDDTIANIKQLTTEYLKGQSSDLSKTKSFPPFWYDPEIFKLRSKTPDVNQKIKDYLCEKGVSCKGLSGLKLINAVEAWVTTNRLIKPLRRKHLAHIIREVSGLESRDDLPDKKITNIYLQWKNNNIFQGYIFKDQQLATPKELLMTVATTTLDENQLSTEMTVGTNSTQLTTESVQEVDIDNHQLHFEIRTKRGPVQDLPNSNTPMLKSYKKLTPDEIRKINNIISNFLGEHSSSKPTSEELPPFWYDEVLYQKRSETEKVNELVRETICDGKSSCSYTTNRELLLASQNWIHEDKKLALNRMKLLAVRILEASGLSGEAMSETRASTILLQWQDNNIFRNVKFKAVDQATLIINPSRNETIIENTEVVGTTIHLIANSYGPIPQEALITTNHIREAYLDGRPSLVDTSVPLIPIWYDFELYQKRGRTDKANEAVENFLCDQGVNCGALTNQQLVLTANEWAKKVPTDAEILEKKKELAPIILEAYGIADRNITDTSALNAVFQWENNNALDEYTWIKPKQLEFEAIKSQNGSLEITDELKEVSPNTVDPDLVQVQKTVVYLINDMVHLPSSQEALPIFYYDYELFQKRSKTNDVNKMLKEFLIKEGIEIKELSESELAEGIRKWIEKADPNEAFDKSGRRQYLAYLLLNTYGVENVRLGEFMPFDKMNAIFMQWKINALLEGYLYEEITKETIHHYIGKTEHYLVTYFKQQKKSSKQIYDDFIHDRPATVSKENPLPLIYVHYNLFKNREETSTANRAVRRFLTGKGVSFINRSKSELVRKLKEWIFKGETYTEIVAREKEIAKLIRKAYGLIDKDIAINKARNVLIQWVNNNAQLGYTYKENDNFEEEPQLSQRIKTFIRDNGENIFQNRTIDTMEKEKPKLDNTQRLIAFLIENGVKTEDTTPEKLGKTVADWGLLKGATQETLNMVRVKQLAQVLLGKPLDGVISETQATTIVADWLSETLGNRTSAPQVEDEKQQTITSTPSSVTREKVKYKGIQWQDSKVMNQIEQLFRQEGLLTGNVTKETILIAMGKWFTQEGSGMVLSYTKLQKLAKTILKELNLYGGGDKETISDRDAKLTITKWVFENVLGCPIEMYMIKQILDSPNPSQFTIGSLRKLFEVDDLRIAGRIVLHVLSIPEGGEAVFKKLWTLLLEEALPNYFLETSALSDDLLISDYGSLVQLIGTKLLVDEGIQTQYNQEEIRTIGSFFLEEAIKNEVVNFDELHYILIPALLSVSQLEPVLLRKALEEGNYREVALQTFIRYWQKGNIQIMENQRMFNQVFDLYQESILKWRRKKVLAEEEAKKCIGQGTKTSALVLEQRYLGGSDPCPDYFTSPNIEDVYKTLTRAVSDSFYPFDKKLIEYATNSFDATESQFIFSPETHTYLAHAKLESKPGVPGRGTAPPFSAAYLNQQVVIELSQCDLFVAVQGNEERWYALKKLEEDGGYSYYRVDKDPLLYLKFGLFDQTEIKGKGYKIEGDSIRIGIRLYTFSVRMDQSKKLSHGDEKEKFIDTLSLQHSEALYTQLYRSGDDKTIAQQTWDILKHFIPFYDCVTGIAEQDAAKAVPSCLIDVVLLIPVLGQITALNTRFALGVARAIATGGIRNGIRKGVQFAPNIFELKKVLYSTLRYMDPGFGLVAGGSKLLLKGLVKLKNQVYITKEVKVVLEKLSKSISSPDLPSGMVKAKLPDGGSEIVVKLVKHHLYASVTDLKTGTVSGRYFVLKGDHLEPFSGSVTFTSEQQALIDRLAIKTNNPSQIIVTEPNVNPRAYGEGPVWTLAYGEGTEMKVDKEEAGAEYFVQMNQKLVPIRITAIEGHGVRFDVVEGEKIHPVNYNGIEWYFEGKTSPFISKELAEEVGKKIDDFESIEDPTT